MDYRTYEGRDHEGLMHADSRPNADLLAWTAERLSGVSPTATCS